LESSAKLESAWEVVSISGYATTILSPLIRGIILLHNAVSGTIFGTSARSLGSAINSKRRLLCICHSKVFFEITLTILTEQQPEGILAAKDIKGFLANALDRKKMLFGSFLEY
jgi:hypothetical protein